MLIPGGRIGVWLVGGVGAVACSCSFLLGLVPPDQLKTGNPVTYVVLLSAATVLLCLPPFLWSSWARRRGRAPLSPQPSPAR